MCTKRPSAEWFVPARRRRGDRTFGQTLAGLASISFAFTVLAGITVSVVAPNHVWAGDKAANCSNPPCPVVTDFNNSHPFKVQLGLHAFTGAALP